MPQCIALLLILLQSLLLLVLQIIAVAGCKGFVSFFAQNIT